jgi:hypothetical protein
VVLLMEQAMPPMRPALIELPALSADQLRPAFDGWHAVMPLGGAIHRLWLRAEPVKRVTYELKLPLDADFEARNHAADRLWRALNNRPLGPARGGLTHQQRKRVGMALRALDGHLDGASYRSIAEVLFGRARIPERGWKTHDLRSRTIRLVNLGLRMMRGGYRNLLRFRRKGR